MKKLFGSLLTLSFISISACGQPSQNLNLSQDLSQYSSYSANKNDIAGADWFSNLRPDLQQYYLEAKGKTGAELFDSLHTIISRNNHVIGYQDSKSFMYSTIDNISVNNKTGVLDAYSEVFVPGSGEDGGKYIEPGDANKDGSSNDFINCEHTWPQSFFNKELPMVGDLNHLQSTLAVPNRMRSDFPFGMVTNNVSYTTSGGSKLGISSNTNAPINKAKILQSLLNNTSKIHKNDPVTQNVNGIFEPGDQQKGRTARAMMYFYLRYYDQNIRQGSFNKTNFWVSKVSTFKTWSEQTDPINDVDMKRNDAVFKKQGNRNPFIDIPNLASLIGETVLKSK